MKEKEREQVFMRNDGERSVCVWVSGGGGDSVQNRMRYKTGKRNSDGVGGGDV